LPEKVLNVGGFAVLQLIDIHEKDSNHREKDERADYEIKIPHLASLS
jgi:hypothetical protein